MNPTKPIDNKDIYGNNFDNCFKALNVKVDTIQETLAAIKTLVSRFKDFDLNDDLPPLIGHDSSVLGRLREHDNRLDVITVRLIDVQRRLESLFQN